MLIFTGKTFQMVSVQLSLMHEGNKYIITKSDESTFDIWLPILKNGNLEHFLKFLLISCVNYLLHFKLTIERKL